MDDVLVSDPEGEIRTADLYGTYRWWCRENGHWAESSTNFKRSLEKYGINITRAKPRYSSGEKTTLVIGYQINNAYVSLSA